MANIDIQWEIEGGQISAEESVKGLLNVIPSKGVDQSGTFWTWDGRVRILSVPAALITNN